MKVLSNIHNRYSRIFWVIMGGSLLFIVGALDYFTGTEISFSLFYVFPIALISWLGSWKLGTFFSLVGAVLWLGAEFFAGASYTHPIILYWNTLVRLSIFLLVPYLIKLGRDLTYESTMARTDFVTGAFNSRHFQERLQVEIDRASRYAHPFTIAYLDVDNFKIVNDRFGHSVGDKVLHAIVDSIKRTLRKTDIIARVGGDEFALLLPETDMDAAQIAIAKTRKNLLDEMNDNHWPVTVSVGVVTFVVPPNSADLALDVADQTMYMVKQKGKNNVAHVTHK